MTFKFNEDLLQYIWEKQLFVNAISPFVFYYEKVKVSMATDVAISYLTQTKAEQNSIINQWKTLDIQCSDALSTQGLLHLYKIYCKNKKCLRCNWGKNSFLEAMNLIKYIERYAFGICTLLGEKFGIRASTIRLYFIYVSFFTFGSPVVLYLAIAFWLNIKHYMVARKQTLWDL